MGICGLLPSREFWVCFWTESWGCGPKLGRLVCSIWMRPEAQLGGHRLPHLPSRTLSCTQVGRRCCSLAVELESVTPAVRTELGETQSQEPRAGGGDGWDRMSDLGVWQEAELRQGGRRGLESEVRAAPQEMSNLSSVCKLEFRVRFKGKQSLLRETRPDFRTDLWPAGKKVTLGDWRPDRTRPSSISPFLEFLPPLVLKAQDSQN